MDKTLSSDWLRPRASVTVVTRSLNLATRAENNYFTLEVEGKHQKGSQEHKHKDEPMRKAMGNIAVYALNGIAGKRMTQVKGTVKHSNGPFSSISVANVRMSNEVATST